MVKSCCVCRTEQSAASPNLIFHRVPKDPETQTQWLQILGKKNSKTIVVCSKHFLPEDYRDFCKMPLLKKGTVPRLNICDINTVFEDDEISEDSVQYKMSEENIHENPNFESVPVKKLEISPGCSMQSNENSRNLKRSEDSVIQAQCNEVSEEDIHKSLNYESMSVSKLEITSDCSMQSSNGNIKNLKRKSDFEDESRVKQYLCLKKFGIFRKEDFKDENSWKKYLLSMKGLRKEKLQLRRKNELLLSKINTFKDIIQNLKENQLLPNQQIVLKMFLKLFEKHFRKHLKKTLK
ncbi:uncharacterized protein LOC109863119 [Pseudomyrmex gracilis]|uniref:uncharacterized protein LOC109863119 n=1 Tax=Pseudomyrmex gracilis TaxID=219809 RepID=UPI000994AC82|nr:uncharacterized protein LOC109863119 [Pseudomyrmex gracilis]